MSPSSNSSNTLVAPNSRGALEQLKFEVAQELGITLSPDGYQGNKTSYENGSIGGYITKRLVTLAEQQLAGQFK